MPGDSIPVICIDDLANKETRRALDNACREWGFFQVVDHGIQPAVISKLMREMHNFFSRPAGEKQNISRTAENPWGFYDQELTKNTADWKEIYDYGPDHNGMIAQWPRALPEFRIAVCAYYQAAENLAFRLLAALSENLGMHADHLSYGFQPEHTSFLRLNYYPLCPTPERPPDVSTPQAGHLGINHHTDAGALTVLAQDAQRGLEVVRDGKWYPVAPRENALVINIGDIVQVWSNDRYRAPLHRVTASADRKRFSAPFFFNPAYHTNYAPLPTTTTDQPPRYRSINWGDFRNARASGDYADSGEEVQISHYSVSVGAASAAILDPGTASDRG